jgi:predicted methyltransferase
MPRLRRVLLAGALALATSHAWAAGTPAYITSAVSDAGRPAADKARDPLRKPAELLAFFQIKPGQKLAELLPGNGYFTRIFSKAVGAGGKVYVLGPPGAAPTVTGVTGAAAYANVAAIAPSATSLNLPEPVDLVWTSLNYHDLKNPPSAGGAPVDIAAFNKAIYQALKPGGYYVVIDHAANTGDLRASADKHRIDQLTVVREIAAAGFILQAETQALRHPEDPRTAPVFALNGATDQFAMLFRKPDLSLGGAIRDPQE